MDYKQLARDLLDEWALCERARVPKNVIDLQLEKDKVSKLVFKVDQEYAWGNDEQALADACNALTPKLARLKERIVFEVLKDGTV